MQHTYSSLKIHAVFATLNRARLIDRASRSVSSATWAASLASSEERSSRANGVEHHVHLLLALPPAVAGSEAIGKIKGSSSKWIRESFPHRARFAWQRGFGAFSVSESQVPRVVAYIDAQKEHHERLSFADEFAAILRAHGLG